MIILKSRLEAPPGGFWVSVPEARYNQQFWDFQSAVSALMRLIQSNPGIRSRFPQLPRDRAAAETYVDQQNAMRVSAINGAGSYITTTATNVAAQSLPPPSFPRPQHPAKSWPSAAGESKPASKAPSWFAQLGTGIKTIADWLGQDGKPVAAEVSERRAAVCAICSLNKQGDLLTVFTKPAANLIRRQLEERKQLKLSTSKDALLGVCSACGCPLKLKLHVPLEIIKAHTPSEQEGNLDPGCWIRHEKL